MEIVDRTSLARNRVVQSAIASGRKYSKLSRSPQVTDESTGVRYAKALERLRDLGINTPAQIAGPWRSAGDVLECRLDVGEAELVAGRERR